MICEICGATRFKYFGRFAQCLNCGALYEQCFGCDSKVGSPDPDIGSVFLGILIGVAFVSPFIYIPVLRNWMISTIAKGAKVAKSKVEEWHKKGETEEKAPRVPSPT